MKPRILAAAMILTTAAALAVQYPCVFAGVSGPLFQEPTPLPEAVTGAAAGEIYNGTSGEPAADLNVTLSAFSEDGLAFSLSIPANSSGEFTFNQVELNPEWIYLASTEFEGVLYSSIPVRPSSGQTTLFLQLIVYESTESLNDVSVSRLHVAFDFLEPGSVRVGELWVLENKGKHSVLPPDGMDIVLSENFHNLEIDSAISSGVTVTETGFILEQPILPGEDAGSIMFSYSLPYVHSLSFKRSFPIPIQSGTVLVPDSGISINSGFLNAGEDINLSGTSVQAYNLGNLPADDTLQLDLTGTPPGASFLHSSSPGNLSAGIFMLVLAVFFTWTIIWRRKSDLHTSTFPAPNSLDDAVHQLAVLDLEFESGRLTRNHYLKERSLLKNAAARLDGDNDDHR